MRVAILSLILSAGLAGTPVFASDAIAVEKVKTGILPAGGLYELYQVTCQDRSATSVASMDRRRRWCSGYDGELSCFRDLQAASQMACSTANVAATEENLESMDAFQ
jgi:hypothetical protein